MRPQRDAVDRLEEAIKKLRTAYEKYFAGIERIEPIQDRAEVKKAMRRLISQRTNNTARRFRIQSLQATLITHENYWNRITRQIEEGTHRRDLMRMRRQSDQAQPPAAGGAATAAGGGATSAGGAATAAGGAKQKAAKDNNAYPASMQRLHQAFLSARAKAGDKRAVSIDTLAATVRKQTAAIKERYQCNRVEFKVTIKDGKAILKAVPK